MTDLSTIIAKVKELLPKAVEGPWHFSPWHIEEGPPAVRKDGYGIVATTAGDDTAAFIALLNPVTVSALLSRIEELERYEDRLCIDPGGSDKIDELESAMGNLMFRATSAEAKLAEAVKWVDAHLSKTAMLPKRVDEMNEVEADIFKIAAYHMGFLQFLLQSLSALIPEKKEG